MTRDEQPRLDDLDLAGERVRLRPVRAADAASAFPLIADREPILRWLVWKGPRDVPELEEAYSAWRQSSDAGANYRLAIEDGKDGAFAGTISVRFHGHPFVGDLGYWVGEEFWGRGFASEAILLSAHVAFTHLRASALVAEVFIGNEASARVLEKVGFERAEATETQPLAGLGVDAPPMEIDRPKHSYTLTRRRFSRLWPGWSPRREHVVLERP